HMRAGSMRDAFFGQGFAHAQDRLWQMDYDRRRAAGRWAEWAGKAWVDQDIFMRRLGLPRTAEADYAAFDDETRAMVDAYAGGPRIWSGPSWSRACGSCRGATTGCCTAVARRRASRCWRATRTGCSMCPMSTTRIMSPARSGTWWGCRSRACQASRTSGTTRM